MSVLLLTSDQDFVARVRMAVGEDVTVERVDDTSLDDDVLYGVGVVLSSHPSTDVVVIGPGIPVERGLDYAHEFDIHRPEISVILCATTTADVLSEALQAGVRDVIDPLAGDSRVLDAIKRSSEAAVRARGRLRADERADESGGRVIAVVSPKGGSGKTTISTNLAIGLATAAPGQVAIVDLDLQFGDVATALQLMPESDITNAAPIVSSLDSMSLKVLLTHHPVDLYALCAPESPADGERISANQSAEIIKLMQRDFQYVVIDTAAGLGEHTLSAIECATDIVLICSMDVPGVRSFRKTLVTLDELGMTAATRHIVLTRADARVGLNLEDIERTIGRSVDVTIPSTRAVPLSINQGTPILQSEQRRSDVYSSLTRLVGRFADLPEANQPRRWRRRR
jgi:pilus assembly protein CpaE